MIKSFRKTHFLYVIIDLFIIASVYFISYYIRYPFPVNISYNLKYPYSKEYAFIYFLWSLFIVTLFKKMNLYGTDRNISIPKEIYRVFIGVFYSSILIGTIIFFGQYKFYSRKVFLLDVSLFFIFLSGWRVIKRLVLRKMISKGFHNLNVLLIGSGHTAKAVLEEIKRIPWWGLRVVGFLGENRNEKLGDLTLLGSTQEFLSVVNKYFIDEVIITEFAQRRVILAIIREAEKLHLGLRIAPENLDYLLPDVTLSFIGRLPLMTYKERSYHPSTFLLKRIFDFIFSLLLLIILSPLFLIISILIKLDSKGPLFYVQKRVGIKGVPFDFYKFRSMVRNAEELKEGLLQKNEVMDGVIFKIKKDPRMTKVGAILRKYSLDELPQLFNIFKGDLSLVGPRPPTLEEVRQYNHNQMRRLSIRPGLTGLSQIQGRSNLTFYKWIKWDLWYINNWSFGLDLWILLKTIPVVITGKGAY